MPYIAKRRRDYYDARGLTQLCTTIKDARTTSGTEGPLLSAGDVAYIVYKVLLAAVPVGVRFADRNAYMGAVDEARMEYRRRVHEPAEDAAIYENGDIE